MAPQASAASPVEERHPVDTVDAHTLLGSARMLRIELEGELYTLRLTRNNRLILTK